MRRMLIVALLSGCATQQSIQTDGNRYEHRSANSPQRAASCVSRNLEDAIGYAAPLREHANPGSFEVSARRPGSMMAYAVIAPSDSGSRVTLWIQSMNLFHESIARKTFAGC